MGFTDYDKNGGQSSNVDSGRGSVAYSSGRRPEPPDADSDARAQPGPSQQPPQGTLYLLIVHLHRSYCLWNDILQHDNISCICFVVPCIISCQMLLCNTWQH